MPGQKLPVDLLLADVGSVNFCTDQLLGVLRSRYDLKIYADPKGAGIKVLTARGIPFLDVFGDDMTFLRRAKLVLCGTNAKALDLQVAGTAFAQGAGTPTIWFGDAEGSGGKPAERVVTPTVLTAVNEFSKERLLRERVGCEPSRVVVTGSPGFDELADFNLADVRSNTREKLALAMGETTAVYFASSSAQFKLKETLLAVLRWADERQFRFGVKFHPADPEKGRYEKIVKQNIFPHKRLDVAGLSNMEIAAACDLVVTDYSTVGYSTALLGIPTMFLMGESARTCCEKAGMPSPYFSVIDRSSEMSPAWLVTDPLDFSKDADEIVDGAIAPFAMRMAARQARFQPLTDGYAWSRVANLIDEVAQSL